MKYITPFGYLCIGLIVAAVFGCLVVGFTAGCIYSIEVKQQTISAHSSAGKIN